MPDGAGPDPAGYEVDFYQWTQTQAARLRGLGARGSNQDIDWENVAAEIESLGKSDRRQIGSRLETILEHLLKLRFSTTVQPRAGWINTVQRERRTVADLLLDSPSLRPQVHTLIARNADLARGAASAALGEFGEHEAARRASVDDMMDLQERVLDESFIPHPPQAATSA